MLFKVEFAESRMSFDVGFEGLQVVEQLKDAEKYSGPYEVTPQAHEAQTLNTANKLMLDDVTVHKVPFYDVSNTTGGKTVYIASEV